jgi:hypothetical protein
MIEPRPSDIGCRVVYRDRSSYVVEDGVITSTAMCSFATAPTRHRRPRAASISTGARSREPHPPRQPAAPRSHRRSSLAQALLRRRQAARRFNAAVGPPLPHHPPLLAGPPAVFRRHEAAAATPDEAAPHASRGVGSSPVDGDRVKIYTFAKRGCSIYAISTPPL